MIKLVSAQLSNGSDKGDSPSTLQPVQQPQPLPQQQQASTSNAQEQSASNSTQNNATNLLSSTNTNRQQSPNSQASCYQVANINKELIKLKQKLKQN